MTSDQNSITPTEAPPEPTEDKIEPEQNVIPAPVSEQPESQPAIVLTGVTSNPHTPEPSTKLAATPSQASHSRRRTSFMPKQQHRPSTAVQKFYKDLKAQVGAELRNAAAGVHPSIKKKKGKKRTSKSTLQARPPSSTTPAPGAPVPVQPSTSQVQKPSASQLLAPSEPVPLAASTSASFTSASGKKKKKPGPPRKIFEPPKFVKHPDVIKGSTLEADIGRANILLSGWGDKSAVNEIDEETGQSALHLAASKGRLAIVAILLSKKASIDVQDNAGRTPLYLAASAGFHDVVLTLLTSGANQNIANKFGNLPIHAAIRNGQRDVCELLVAQGADMNAKNNSGETPLQRSKDSELTKFLDALGKQVESHNAKNLPENPPFETLDDYRKRIAKRTKKGRSSSSLQAGRGAGGAAARGKGKTGAGRGRGK